MTAEPVARPDADAETTTVIRAVDAPLPPYAKQGGSYPSVPMSPSAPTPPPSYPPAAPTAPAPQLTKTSPAHAAPTVADAMVEISMPPLAPAVAERASLETPVQPQPEIRTEMQPQTQTDTQPAATVMTIDAPVESSVTELVPLDAPPLDYPSSTTAAVMPPPAAETITCPECGTVAHVTLNRRESMDFCRTCDFPLFWTPTKVVRDPSGLTDESLRRLPGQAGRATIASLPCPFCYEPNALSAQTCIRCQRPMHPVEEAPAPAPVYVAPPEPVVVAPPNKVAWWVWALLALGAAALIVLVVLIGTGTIG